MDSGPRRREWEDGSAVTHVRVMRERTATAMRTDTVIDDDLMDEALNATGLKTQKEVVELASGP